MEDPQLKDDEVLIKVAATALNRADTQQRKGRYPPPKGASELLGLECSGTVEAVGSRVSRWKVGDQVKFRVLLGLMDINFYDPRFLSLNTNYGIARANVKLFI